MKKRWMTIGVVAAALIFFPVVAQAEEVPPETGSVGVGASAVADVPASEEPEAPAEPAPKAPAEPAPKAPAEPAQEAPAEPAQEAPAEPAPEAPAEPAQEVPSEPPPKAPVPAAEADPAAAVEALNALALQNAPAPVEAPEPALPTPPEALPEAAVQAVIAGRPGGEFFDDRWWRYRDENGRVVTNSYVHLPDGRLVYYDKNGNMVFGTQVADGHTQHFDRHNGNLIDLSGEYHSRMIYEWDWGRYVSLSGPRDWYYFNRDTASYARNAFVQLPDGRTVYYNDKYNHAGIMQFGLIYIDGMPYNLDPSSGNLLNQTGEVFLPGKGWAYFNAEAKAYAKGFVTLPDGRTVYYGDDHIMRFGPVDVGGVPYHLDNSNGALLEKTGEAFVPGKGWAYLDPKTHTYAKGFTTLPDGRTVYYGDDHAMRFGPMEMDGMTYHLDPANGNLLNQSGEAFVPGKGWTYLDPKTHTYAKGFTTLPDGRTVYYGDDHAMRFGTADVGGVPYHFDPSNGQFLTQPGEVFVPGKGWAYVDPKTRTYAKGFTLLPDGRVVYYGNDHIMRLGMFADDAGNYYYSAPQNGNLQRGWQDVPGIGRRYFNYYSNEMAAGGWHEMRDYKGDDFAFEPGGKYPNPVYNWGFFRDDGTFAVDTTSDPDDNYLLFELINQERRDAGVHPISFDEEMALIATMRAKELQNYYNPEWRPNGSYTGTILAENGYDLAKQGYNFSQIVIGAATSPDGVRYHLFDEDIPEAVMSKRLLLDPRQVRVGIGAFFRESDPPNKGDLYTGVYKRYWVLFFASVDIWVGA